MGDGDNIDRGVDDMFSAGECYNMQTLSQYYQRQSYIMVIYKLDIIII